MRFIYFKKNNLMVPCERVKKSFIQAYNENGFIRNNFIEASTPISSPKK